MARLHIKLKTEDTRYRKTIRPKKGRFSEKFFEQSSNEHHMHPKLLRQYRGILNRVKTD